MVNWFTRWRHKGFQNLQSKEYYLSEAEKLMANKEASIEGVDDKIKKKEAELKHITEIGDQIVKYDIPRLLSILMNNARLLIHLQSVKDDLTNMQVKNVAQDVSYSEAKLKELRDVLNSLKKGGFLFLKGTNKKRVEAQILQVEANIRYIAARTQEVVKSYGKKIKQVDDRIKALTRVCFKVTHRLMKDFQAEKRTTRKTETTEEKANRLAKKAYDAAVAAQAVKKKLQKAQTQ